MPLGVGELHFIQQLKFFQKIPLQLFPKLKKLCLFKGEDGF